MTGVQTCALPIFISVNINQQDILDQYQISKKEVEDVIDFTVKEITVAFADQWQAQAKADLKSTRSRYIQNLKVIDEGRMQGAVVLDYTHDPLIKMIEEGHDAYDLKLAFEKSNKKHIKKDGGWYLTVPFQIGTPDVQVESGFANTMPNEVYNIAKNKPTSSVTNRSQGLTATEIGSGNGVPQNYQIPKTRAAIINIPKSQAFEEYKHKTTLFQGVVKTTDSVTGQNSYTSFRRVSDKSDPNSWIHPGFTAANLAEKAFDNFESKMQTVLENAMGSSLKNIGIE